MGDEVGLIVRVAAGPGAVGDPLRLAGQEQGSSSSRHGVHPQGQGVGPWLGSFGRFVGRWRLAMLQYPWDAAAAAAGPGAEMGS